MKRSLRSRPERNKVVRRSVAMLLRNGAEVFARDAEAWGLTPRRALILALAPIVASFAVIATIPYPDVFLWLIDEDSILENMQFGLILTASVFSAWLSAHLLRNGRRGLGMLYVLLAMGAFFVAGEEISWGQRIFGLRTPERLEAINWQHEISAHNIYGFNGPFTYALMLGGLYGAVMPFIKLAFSADRHRSTLSYLLIPPLCLVPAFFMPFGYRLCRLVFRPELHYPHRAFAITEFSEVTEVCLYFGVLMFAWLNLRRLRAGTAVSTPASPEHGQ